MELDKKILFKHIKEIEDALEVIEQNNSFENDITELDNKIEEIADFRELVFELRQRANKIKSVKEVIRCKKFELEQTISELNCEISRLKLDTGAKNFMNGLNMKNIYRRAGEFS